MEFAFRLERKNYIAPLARIEIGVFDASKDSLATNAVGLSMSDRYRLFRG